MNDESAAPRAYVLEDDPDIAALEADLLREMGFSVVTCTRIVELGDLMDVALPHLMVVDVMLPDDGVADALKTLINLDRDRSLLQREIAAVDLRLADRVSVRIRDKAELTMPDSGSALPDVPTSSTKRNT